MTLQIVVGRSGSGKTYQLLEEVRQDLLKAPIGSPMVYLVPDQMTFQIEYDLVQTPGLGGILRAQVFSFTRLAWRVLQETGGMSRLHLDNVGTNMLIRKIIENRKHDFLLYGKAAEKAGFIDQIENMIHECKRYCITSEGMRHQVEELEKSEQRDITLLHKLHDFSIIYNEFEKQLFDKYVDSEDYLRLLAEKIPSSTYLKEATILIDGFHSFTPQELVVLEKLIDTCQSVKIALTLDKPLTHQPHELHLFHMTGKTYFQLNEIADRVGQKVEVQVLQHNKRSTTSSLAHIEQHYESRPTVQSKSSEGVLLRGAVNRRAEVEGVAKEILRLVREQNYRYRDMAIILRNTSLYHDLLETVFTEYEIPVFIDQKRSMLHHPLIEFIRSALEIVSSGFRYESVFRAVKTDLLFPVDEDEMSLREDFDLLENYVLAYGIQGYRWKDTTKKWQYRRIIGIDDQGLAKTSAEEEMEQKIHDLRILISNPLLQFEERLKKAKTGVQFAEALYLLLEEINVPGKLEKWRLQTEQSGEVSKAKEHGQVWSAVVDLLDQFVELMGKEEIPFSIFQQTMEAGLEALRFALVPPAIDQVVVGDFEHSRFSHLKATFILGINDGVIPAIPSEHGVLNEDEREQLSHHGLQLAPGGKQQLLDEQFLLYLAVSSASNQLWLSYSLANEEGKSLVPSIFIKRIKDLYPTLREELLVQDPTDLTEEEQLEYITTPIKTVSYLASQLQQWKRHYPISTVWWDVYNTFDQKREWKTLRDRVLGSLFYQNREQTLPTDVSDSLYGDSLTASVSRMELFQGCPFSHFSSYGLGLQERQIYRLEAPDIGQFFHAALKMMADELHKQNLSWTQLSKKQCMDLAHEVVNELAPRIQKEILLSSNRYHYLKRKLTDVIGRASLILSEHAKASGFAPVGLELGFGRNGQLPAIEFTLKNGTKMELVGRIDRVDVASSSKGSYLRIVDYKSSQKSLNLAEVYYGLSLQMLTYLDIVLSNSKAWLGQEALPAGVLYFHVHNPMIKAKQELAIEDIEDELLKSFKMKGLLLGDEEAVRLMDTTIDSGHSKIVSAGLKKSGGFYPYSQIASEDEFDVLRKHVRRTFKNIGDEMVSGKVDIAPYQLKDRKPCKFCSFKPVCQFDESLEENTFVTLEHSDDKTILTRLKEEVEKNETIYTTKA
ncbi:helicase-exonuclease AddAB subunit AddB [Bacillus suaedaesalsae]|uniref:ATP-dependent helicase/deoxyribonuclease subunit B n=1 Tax=Bacillus suaedaesalsae TaxID=2810349 RepID=A0ABS2DFA7_9BACI|nr:helicase-exonuclease AddAB subunit AddB [Bacillus suaedaesalsae]MBM6617140.1 helicase-exonuclease AddAB subunit AddB [Bacillus suaedaesalsae]